MVEGDEPRVEAGDQQQREDATLTHNQPLERALEDADPGNASPQAELQTHQEPAKEASGEAEVPVPTPAAAPVDGSGDSGSHVRAEAASVGAEQAALEPPSAPMEEEDQSASKLEAQAETPSPAHAPAVEDVPMDGASPVKQESAAEEGPAPAEATAAAASAAPSQDRSSTKSEPAAAAALKRPRDEEVDDDTVPEVREDHSDEVLICTWSLKGWFRALGDVGLQFIIF